MIESLESRLLYARHLRPVFSVSDDGILRISGSTGDDVIIVRGSTGNITLSLNNRVTKITQPVRRAIIYGGLGNDLIDCSGNDSPNASAPTQFRVFADGGLGRDTINSGEGGDTLIGGRGADRLQGLYYNLGRPVYMDGGPGDDTLLWGTIVHGGSGYDRLTTDLYGVPIFASGLESQYQPLYGGRYTDPDNTDLTTVNGRLVFKYLSDGETQRAISAPYLRDDGRIGITITSDTPDANHPSPPATRWTVQFNDRYTVRARQKGLVLSFDGTDVYQPPQDWAVMLPGS